MKKVPQLLSDRSRHVANVGKFIVEAIWVNHVFGVMSDGKIVDDPTGERATIFDTLEDAEAAAVAADVRGEKFRNVALRHRPCHLVDSFSTPRLYRAA